MHLDSDFNDRGTVNTEIFIDLSSEEYKKTLESGDKNSEDVENLDLENRNKNKKKEIQSLDALSGMDF